MEFIRKIIDFIKLYLSNHQNVENIFYQLLRDDNYEEALKLAQRYSFLDLDLLHQSRWRRSNIITPISIRTVLAEIKDKLWIINECCDTIPTTYEACKTLISLGLEEASIELLSQLGTERSPDDLDRPGIIEFKNLNDRQKELCRCRQDLLHHQHALEAYTSILGSHRNLQQNFEHIFYDKFRRMSPLESCINYAHDGDSHAVEILLNFYYDDLSPHLLAILSNFPETLSPYKYRNLLPCLQNGKDVFEWPTEGVVRKSSDWSNRIPNSPFMVTFKHESETFLEGFYKENQCLHKYKPPFMAIKLSDWYKERALELELRTLLLSNAIQLLHLGSELNIPDLQKTHDDLVEFDKIIYDCCTENDLYMSFTEFNNKTELERLIIMTGDSIKACEDRFRFYVIPYMSRRDKELGLEGKANLLREYFRELAHKREQICKSIYSHLLDKLECDSFVAEWTRDLDEVIDEIGEEIKVIERERQAKQLSLMACQTYKLGDYDECYEACQLIMKRNHGTCWPHCCNLGMNRQFNNYEAKYKLLAFALAHCDEQDGKTSSKILDYIIELRKRDEKIQKVYLFQEGS